VRSHFGPVELTDRWSGQIIEPVDGLPFIGRNSLSSHVHVATGYSGNGMTFGALAGMIVTNAILGRDDPWAALYAATRVKPLAAAVEYVRENVDFPRHLVADRLTNLGATASSADEVRPGEGRIVACGGEKYAVHRDTHGTLHVLSPVCTHLGCDVRWNAAERSWDCPCHGSRFTPEGAVLNGPAVRELSPKELPAGDRPRRSA
jgi:Rieske Fe-S protein